MKHQNPSINILRDKQLYIFDMDGTIYLGSIVFDFAIRFIENLRRAGKRVMFFTNNASRSTNVYLEKLTRLGFSPTAEEIMSSADVTVAYLKTYHKDQTVYLVGTKQLESQFCAAGIRLATGKEDIVDVVVSSFDTELTYEKLNDGCRLIRGGATYLCTHPDFNCPTDTGFMPDSGAIAALITASTGVTPRYLGKPYPEVVEMIERVTGIPRENTCIFGDRLYTDIALGAKNGVTSVLVLTGEGTLSEAEALSDEEKPTFIFPSLREVNDVLFDE
ncbi:MAG: HAD-IIA family hydrolase [Ruminococcaceae bacterium]|nr:HAD-IIA family hydrolase [Oscillospiraceae bacterium]